MLEKTNLLSKMKKNYTTSNNSIMKNIVLIGAGGHGKVVLDILTKIIEAKTDDISILGFIDDNQELFNMKDLDNLGSIDDIPKILRQMKNPYFIICIGDNALRKKVFEKLSYLRYYTAIHPNSIIGNNVKIGHGSVVMAGAVINTDTYIGSHCIINTGCNIDHDNSIENFVHISPGCSLAGNVRVKENTHIGTGSSVIPDIIIGEYSVIGAGSVVISNIPSYCTAVGSPAKPIKYYTEEDR